MENDVVQESHADLNRPMIPKFGRRKKREIPEPPSYEEALKKAAQRRSNPDPRELPQEHERGEEEGTNIKAVFMDIQHRIADIKKEIDRLNLDLASIHFE